MSCQHARPQGRIAGHNVVADLLGRPLIDYHQEDYVTVLDLGAWGALYMQGWDRRVVVEGAAAKRTKHEINHRRIYPPAGGDAGQLLAAAAPVIQAVPNVGGET
jgi:NADH dehydrogenase